MLIQTGQIVQLFRKVKNGQPMQPESLLVLERSLGIVGDLNAYAISPRQVLIVRHED